MRSLSRLLFFFGLGNVLVAVSLVTIFWDQMFNLNTEDYPYQTIGVAIIALVLISMGYLSMLSVLKYEKSFGGIRPADNTKQEEEIKKIKEDFKSRTTTPNQPSSHDLH